MEEEFEEHLRARKLSEKTVEQYLIQYNLLNRECADLTQKAINRFVIKHPTFITRAFLKNFFEFLEEQGVDHTALPKIPKIKGRKQMLKKKILKVSELKRIRKWLLNHKNYKYVLLLDLTNHCALRREEAVTIKKIDFDWESWQGKSLRLKVFAKGKQRIVVVPNLTANRIAKYIVKINDTILLDDPIFKIGIKRWHEVFKKAVENSCNRNITLHDLRRRRATLWLDSGVDLDEVRRRLGHSSIATTQKYLIRDEEERLKKWEEEV